MKKNIGSSFDSWLLDEGLYEEATASAMRRVLARRVGASTEDQRNQADDSSIRPEVQDSMEKHG